MVSLVSFRFLAISTSSHSLTSSNTPFPPLGTLLSSVSSSSRLCKYLRVEAKAEEERKQFDASQLLTFPASFPSPPFSAMFVLKTSAGFDLFKWIALAAADFLSM